MSLWLSECLALPTGPGYVPNDALLDADVIAKLRLLPPHRAPA